MVQKNYGAATIWLILALVIIAGGLYLFTKPEAEPAPTPEPVAPAPASGKDDGDVPFNGSITPSDPFVEVRYTKDGFSPAAVTVQISKNEPVCFISDGAPMWVASDPHPTHTGYPAFDQKANGERYCFVFKQEGAYPFHNHRSASHKGTITVTK